jgi:hypothetical protein
VGEYGLTFDGERRARISETKSSIRHLERRIAFLAETLGSWKFAPDALVDHETAEADRVRRTAEEQESRRTTRSLRAFFTGIADAVKAHRDLAKNLEYAKSVSTHWNPDTAARYQVKAAELQQELDTVGPFTRIKAKKK